MKIENKIFNNFNKTIKKFRKNIINSKKNLIYLIKKLYRKNKTIHIYGASTKGNVILQYSRDAPCKAEHVAVLIF